MSADGQVGLAGIRPQCEGEINQEKIREENQNKENPPAAVFPLLIQRGKCQPVDDVLLPLLAGVVLLLLCFAHL